MDNEKLTQLYMQCIDCRTSFEKCNPRILPCLHSICPVCFEKLQKEETSVCPYCSEIIDWSAFKPQHIPEDHHRRSVIDYLRVKDNKNGELQCTECGNGNVTVRCSDCAATLCANCLPGHDRYTKDHTVIPLNELKNKAFSEVVCPVLCAEHKLPLTKYCHSDQTAICKFCEFSNHQQAKDHLVEDIEAAYSERKRDLESAIAEFKTTTEVVENKKVNIDNEISNLSKAKEEHERNFDASVKNVSQYFERRRKGFKSNLNSLLDEQDESLSKKLKFVLSVDNKFKEALHFAENGLTYLGQEDFCQIENLISARFQSLSNTGKALTCDVTGMKHFTFLPCKVGALDQILASKKWLLLIGYYLDVNEETRKLHKDDKYTTVALLYVFVGSEPEAGEQSNPFQVSLKSKAGREVNITVNFNETQGCFEICGELTSSGEYSLALHLEKELKEKRTIQFIGNELAGEDLIKEEFPFGHKERLDHLDPLTFRQQEMQCPCCTETFNFEDETRFPRVLPCLHVIGTDCIAKLTSEDGSITCIVCDEKHVIEGAPTECFPKDCSRWNLSVYWKIRSEGDYIQCQDHVGVKASVWCMVCGQFVCDTCSRAHMEKGHNPMAPLPEKEDLKSSRISELHQFYTCQEKGHEKRLLELYCLTCEKVICHACQFVAHQPPHKVEQCSAVYQQRHRETMDLLQQVTEIQKRTNRLSFHVREEIDALKANVDNQLQRVRKTFNNCKAAIDARKKYIDSELLKVSSAKETELKAQLTELEKTGSTIKTSSNRALDLMGFSSEIPFLQIYSTLKRRLQFALDTLKQTNVSENALVWFIDDFIPKRIESETQKMGSVWPGNLCFYKSKVLVFPATPGQETAILKLQFLDNDGKTVSLKNIGEYVRAEITDSNGHKLEPKQIKINFGEDGVVTVLANVAESGDYSLMFYVMGTAVLKEGVDVKVEAVIEGETKTAENKEKGEEKVKNESGEKVNVSEIGQKPEEVIQIEDSWQRQTREQLATIARLQQENTQLKTSLTQKEKSSKDTEEKLRQELTKTQEAQKKIVGELEKKNSEQMTKITSIEKELAEKTATVSNMQEETKKVTASFDEKMAAAKAAEDKLKQDLQTAQQTHQKQVAELQKTSQENLQKVQTVQAELETKKKEAENKAATIKTLEDEIAKLKAAQPQ